MQVDNFFFIDLALRLLFIDLHFFIATIQIGVIVQVCYTPRLRCVTYTYTPSLGLGLRLLWWVLFRSIAQKAPNGSVVLPGVNGELPYLVT